jgi:hypothetical protein
MTKDEIMEILNANIRGTPVSIDKLIILISDYLTEINYENADKIIYLIQQNPQLIEMAYPKIVEYFTKKYNILSLIYNNKILYYYV